MLINWCNSFHHHVAQFIISNGPRDTTVCNGDIANIQCGAIGSGSTIIIPSWNIVRRNNAGDVISNTSIAGVTIAYGNVAGLMWIPDLSSGTDNATNSYLAVGPVDESYNQSSYQCAFAVVGTPTSNIGTLTVAGKYRLATILCAFMCKSRWL